MFNQDAFIIEEREKDCKGITNMKANLIGKDKRIGEMDRDLIDLNE